jgi:hypothetical protein
MSDYDFNDYAYDVGSPAWAKSVITNTRRNEEVAKTKTDLERERDALQEQIANVELKIASREKFGPDPFKNGDILKIMMTFQHSTTVTYTYAAIKIRNRFWLSGKMGASTASQNGWTYDALVAWFASADQVSVWKMSRAEQVL